MNILMNLAAIALTTETTYIIIAAIIAVLVITIILCGYVKAPPDRAYIISGARKKPRILIGRAGIRIPIFERLDKLYLGQMSVDIKTDTYIPTNDFINVKVDAIAKIRIKNDPEGLQLAAKNFLNKNPDQIAADLTDSLQGNMREIIGTLDLKSVNTDRDSFSDQVMAKASRDMDKLGIEILSCNIQNVTDENGLIMDLGMDNTSKIKKDAAIAKAQAERDVAIAKAEADKAANDAQVIADTEIAAKQNELAIKKAELKRVSDTKIAEAEAAMSIEAEKQRQQKEVAEANANIARQEKEIELRERQVQITERQLEAEIKKKAEADKYATQQKADAALYNTQKASEAELFEKQRQAEAQKFAFEKKAEADKFVAEKNADALKAQAEADRFAKEQEAAAIKARGLAEAEAIKAKGEAEAAAIKAKAEAEAEGLLKKAEAMAKYGEAAKQDMQLQALKVYFEQLPAIAKAVGEGYQNVDKIYMYGGDTSKLAGDIMTNVTQINEGLSQSMGIDIKSLLAGFVGGKVATTNKASEPAESAE